MRRLSLSLLTFIGCSLPSQADPLIEKMRAFNTDGVLYAFEIALDDGEMRATGKVDPSQPEGQRIQIYSPDETEWSKDFRARIEELESEVDGEIWCTEFAESIPDDVERLASTEDTVTFGFTPQPEEDADGMERKMMKQLEGRVTLAKSDAQILAFSMVLPKPFKPSMAVKMNAFEMRVSCARAPDGRTYNQAFDFNISGSAMMQNFNQSLSRQITKLLDPVQ